jgi:prophage regulatory protein
MNWAVSHAVDDYQCLGQRVLTLAEVVAKVGAGKSTIYAMISRGEFPAPIKLSIRKSGWILSEVDSWIDQQRAQRDAAKGA